jgi:hypothetical protein
MARRFDVVKLKQKSLSELQQARHIAERVEKDKADYLFARWACKMLAVDIHQSWERYVEDRLAAALNHSSRHFLESHDVRGVKNISAGFAYYIVRSGGRFFDFKSVSDLLSKGDDWIGKPNNPFRKLSASGAKYIDALAAIRNCVTHGSDAARKAYRRHVNGLCGIKSAPTPGEFLFAINYNLSVARYKPRIFGLIAAVENAIRDT